MSKISQRILLDIVIVLSVFYLPWWISAILVAIGAFFFDKFYEIFFIGLLLDILYGVKTEKFYGVWFIFTVVFTLIYIIIKYFKKNIRSYKYN